MDEDLQERIRRRAHELWERDGRPEGRHDEHWAQAEAEIRAEQDGAKARTAARGKGAPKAAAKGTAAGGRRTKGAAAQPVPAGDPGETATRSASPAATAKRAATARKAGTRAAAEDLSIVAEGPAEAPRGRGTRARR